MTQNSYNPSDHLIKIRSKDGAMKDYYPANWRLYEARLRHPDIVLESEIIHLDPEHNFVIVKALVFVGTDYASATLKCSAMKQGLLSALDKVETAAKARALRDLGISTELALDHDDSDTEDVPTIAPQQTTARQQNGTSNHPSQPTQATTATTGDAGLAHSAEDADELAAIRQECKSLGLASDARSFQDWRLGILHYQVAAKALTTAELKVLREAVEDHKMQGIPASPAT